MDVWFVAPLMLSVLALAGCILALRRSTPARIEQRVRTVEAKCSEIVEQSAVSAVTAAKHRAELNAWLEEAEQILESVERRRRRTAASASRAERAEAAAAAETEPADPTEVRRRERVALLRQAGL